MLEQLLVPRSHRRSTASPWRTACPPRPARPPARSCSTPTPPRRAASRRENHPGARGDQAEDIHGFFQAQGILTAAGGKTSHAAVGGARHGQTLRLRLRADHHQRPGAQRGHRRNHRCTKATSSPSMAAPAMSTREKCRPWRRRFPGKWSCCSPGPTRRRGCR